MYALNLSNKLMKEKVKPKKLKNENRSLKLKHSESNM